MTETGKLTELTDPDCLSPAEEDALLASAPWSRFAVLGDSVAEGLFEPMPGYAERPWGERLAVALRRRRPELVYENFGRRDLRAEEVRRQQLPAALDFEPDLSAIVCGGNDLLVERFDGQAIERELDRLIGPLRERGDVISFTMYDITKALEMPASFGSELEQRLSELNERTRAVAERHDTIHVDLASEPICADPGIYASDFKHGSARGQAICASLTIRRLGEHLRQLQQPAQTDSRPAA